MSTLFKIVSWVKTNGEVESFSRFRLRVMPACIENKIWFSKVTAMTKAPPKMLSTLRKEASLVIGKTCPY